MMSGLIIAHIPMVQTPWILLIGLGIILLSTLLPEMALRRGWHLPTEDLPPIWRAQIIIVALTLMLGWIASDSGRAGVGLLWLLYLPPLLTVGRASERQRWYILTMIHVLVSIAGVHWLALTTEQSLTFPLMATNILGPMMAIGLAAVLTHSQTWVAQMARQGAADRDQIVQSLLAKAIAAPDAPKVWLAIDAACREALTATASEVHVVEDSMPRRYGGDPVRPLADAAANELVSKVTATHTTQEYALDPGTIVVAAPIYGQPQREGDVLAVVLARYHAPHANTQHARRLAIEAFAEHIWPIAAYARRRRLEYDLHDAMKSSVRGLILFSHAASSAIERNPDQARLRLHEVRRTAWGILSDIDLIVHDLSGGAFDSRAMERYVREDIQRLAGKKDTSVALLIDSALPALELPTTRALLHIMREAVINAIEHGHAQHVRVTFEAPGPLVILRITDDGHGFDPTKQRQTAHQGLTAMHERARTIGAQLTIEATLGSGVTVTCELPYKEVGDEPG
jgi:signal transduction histidine kinase